MDGLETAVENKNVQLLYIYSIYASDCYFMH